MVIVFLRVFKRVFSYYIDTHLQEEPRDLTDPIALQRPQRGL